jgi:DNA polymerase III alpha subunit
VNCECKVEKGEFNINNIPLNCPAVWRLIGGGHTVGIFQLETKLGQDWAAKVRPDSIEELAALVSLLRPGPLECLSGDTHITKGRFFDKRVNKYKFSYVIMKDLYEKFLFWEKSKHKGKAQKGLSILSVNEDTRKIFKNTIKKVIKTGTQKVYKLKLKLTLSRYNYNRKRFYTIKATDGHRFLTQNGWKELWELCSGDYIAVINQNFGRIDRKDRMAIEGLKIFRDICLFNYQYKCLFCNWNLGTLDVNHINGNRYTDNSPDNLCFLCPNHHRMYTEGMITQDDILQKLPDVTLPNKNDIRWVLYEGKEDCGEEETYDIAVDGPFQNYIASSVIVHNSGMSQDYADIKFGRKKHSYLHSSLKSILESTYGCMVFQEQALRIATDVAGFNPIEADTLRAAIGKKKAELMAKLKPKFIKGCQNHSKIGRGIAEEIFGWIEKCQRYSFNKSHALSYGMIAYQTAWLKCHFPHEFFTSYLTYSQYKGDPKEEIYKLVQDARLFGVDIFPPDIRRGNIHFQMIEEPQKGVAFGLAHVRGVGASAIQKIVSAVTETSEISSLETWGNFLSAVPDFHRDVGIALIKSGACDCYNMQRSEMVRELEVVLGTTVHDETGKRVEAKGLTNKEKLYFFEQLRKDEMTTRDILLQMAQPPGNKTKTISQMNKQELVIAAVEYLDQVAVAFDGVVYTPDDLKSQTKKEIEELMLQNGYKNVVIKPPCSSDTRRKKVASKAEMLENPLEDTNRVSSVAEKHFLGIALSCSPADDADDSFATHTCLEIAKASNNEAIAVCAIIDNVKYTKTKRGRNPGQSMCFLTMSDSTYSIDAVVFPDAFERLKAFCKNDLICLIYGDKKKGSFIIRDIQKLI